MPGIDAYRNEQARAIITARLDAYTAERAAIARGAAFDASTLPVQGPAPLPCRCGAPWWEHGGGPRKVRGEWVMGAHRGAHGGKHHLGGAEPNGCVLYVRDLVDERVEQALVGRVDNPFTIARQVIREERLRTRIPRGEGEWGIGPSDTQSCPRWIWYRETRPEGWHPLPERDGEAFVGTLLDRALKDLWMVRYPWREFDTKIQIPGLDTRNSEADMFDDLTGDLDDLKSAGGAKWDLLALTGPTEQTWEQGQTYAYGLALAGRNVRRVRLHYIHRERGVDEEHERPYDQEAAEKAVQRLTGYASALDWGDVLPRAEERTGPTNDPICQRCPARAHCWNMDEAAARGRSPESVTILGSEPADPTIEAALAVADAARRERLATEKHEKVTKTALEGLPFREYGAWVLAPGSGGGGLNYFAWARMLEDYYSLPDGERPPLDSLARPQKASSAAVKVSPVRAAKRARKARESLPESTAPTVDSPEMPAEEA
jgi:hypothetical protein